MDRHPVVRLAQYLAGLTTHQELWTEVGRAVVRFFGPDLVAIGTPNDHVGAAATYFRDDGAKLLWKRLTEDERSLADVSEAIGDVLDSGFLTIRELAVGEPLVLVFLPVTTESPRVIAVGHRRRRSLSKAELDVYLAAAGLVSTNASRLESERELQGHRRHLEKLVQERTRELEHANRLLTEEVDRRTRNEERVQELLREKDIMLREVHHRIKNNMQTVGSLLSLQSSRVAEESARQALEIAEHRVLTMMLLYDKIYRSETVDDVSLQSYLEELVDEIVSTYPTLVRVEKDIAAIDVPVQVGFSLGIIVNELVSNAMKHAFGRGGDPVLRVAAAPVNEGLSLCVEDNGPGVAAGALESGFGLSLVRGLARQLGGSFRIDDADSAAAGDGGPGARCVVEVPLVG